MGPDTMPPNHRSVKEPPGVSSGWITREPPGHFLSGVPSDYSPATSRATRRLSGRTILNRARPLNRARLETAGARPGPTAAVTPLYCGRPARAPVTPASG